MPRHSAEERSAAAWRVRAGHPDAPGYLSREAKKLWRSIIEARPPDYFQPGSLQLLEQFCETMVSQRVAMADMARMRESGDPDALALAVRMVKDLSGIVNATAVKLRISVQTEVDRKSGKLEEREPLPTKHALIGGSVEPRAQMN